MIISIGSIVQGKSTYQSRGGHSYILQTRDISESEIEVSYEITGGAVRRRIARVFPREVEVDPRFIWVLGLLRGEGLKSIGPRSSMYRFYVVNNDYLVIRAVVRVLDESRLERWEHMKNRNGLVRISYGPACDKSEVRKYWAEKLGMPGRDIDLAAHAEPQKRARYGSCMLTMSDVLLRRVVDLIAQLVYETMFS
ncbi:MAG: hypothetical protein OK452_10305 [Thaumarchaeota archaeon]|nr:hypothetical protein [Nitrososphaerota archaeon]